MMKPWVKILPYFIVVWMAKRWGERFYIERLDDYCVAPYPDHLISIKKTQQ